MILQNGINIKLIRIWLVDDHQVLRESFKNLIESFDPAFKVIKLADNSKVVLELLKKYYNSDLKPDILILVMELDDYDGYWYFLNVKPQYPDLKILALTNQSDEITLNRIFKHNVGGCLTKQTAVDEVKMALLTIHSGNKYVSETQNSKTEELKDGQFSKLTSRELEFIELSKTSLSYHEIAAKMSVNYSTVNFHRSNVFRKLKIKTRSELVDLIRKNLKSKEVD